MSSEEPGEVKDQEEVSTHSDVTQGQKGGKRSLDQRSPNQQGEDNFGIKCPNTTPGTICQQQ